MNILDYITKATDYLSGPGFPWFIGGFALFIIGWLVYFYMLKNKKSSRHSPADDLKKLHDLKEKGAITESEYQSEKKKLL